MNKMKEILAEIGLDYWEREAECIDEAIASVPDGCGFGSSDRSAARYSWACEAACTAVYQYMQRTGASKAEAIEALIKHGSKDENLGEWLEVRHGYYYIDVNRI